MMTTHGDEWTKIVHEKADEYENSCRLPHGSNPYRPEEPG
jgi:hypothetical protein